MKMIITHLFRTPIPSRHNNNYPKTKTTMDKITFTQEPDCETDYRLSIFYDNQLYEALVNSGNFNSEYVELADLEKVILEGLSESSQKLHQCLNIKTSFEKVANSPQVEHLIITLDLDFQMGKLKRKNESITIELPKKDDDNELIYERLLRQIKQSRTESVVSQQSCNIYLDFDFMKKQVMFRKCESLTKKSKIELVSANKFETFFLDFLMEKEDSIRTFYSNRQNSQEQIDAFATKTIDKFFADITIHELILNYLNKHYHINFVKVLQNGQQIWINYDPKKQPRKCEYHIIQQLHDFDFQGVTQYKFLQQFEQFIYPPKTKLVPFSVVFHFLFESAI